MQNLQSVWAPKLSHGIIPFDLMQVQCFSRRLLVIVFAGVILISFSLICTSVTAAQAAVTTARAATHMTLAQAPASLRSAVASGPSLI